MSVQAPRVPRRTKQPDPKYMTFVEHLQELRRRLTIAVLAIAAGAVGGWFLTSRVLHILDQPLCSALGKNHCTIYVDTVYGAFTLQLKVAIIIGFMFALPVTIYEIWQFIAPAFGAGANRWAPIWMVSAFLLFAAGAVTGYYVIPLALNFFAKFQGTTGTQILPFASQYISFLVLILVIFGISYELPLVLVSLTAVGVTSSRALASKRLYFFFGIFIFSTIITPGADPISPLILGGILYILYEAAILVSRLLHK